MTTIPREVLVALAHLPDKAPCKLILNFDGHGGVVIETFERQEIRKPVAQVAINLLLQG